MRHRKTVQAAALLACALVGSVGLSSSAQTARAAAKGNGILRITQVPTAPPGENSWGEIRGTVRGDARNLRVVIYSLGDTWYVQPFANASFTSIANDGTWISQIHGGYAFAALLVKPTFKPPATLASLPRAGGTVIAVVQASARK